MTTWEELQRDAPIRLSQQQYQALSAAYGDPPRAYHSIHHIISVVGHWHDVQRRVGWGHPAETFLALLYHDAIYLAGKHDNEDRSARFAEVQLGDVRHVDHGQVSQLIRLTGRHGKMAIGDVDQDAALFLDCDMAILGSDQAAFDDYEAGIASEYAAIPVELYRAGRRRFLERLLEAPRIFLSEDFHQRLDGRARSNLTRSCERLAGG
jgi:predicted metal-dependent HD superfamily phosphohydrolase